MVNLIKDFKSMEEFVVGRFEKKEINDILLNRYINILNKLDEGVEVDRKKIMKIMLLVSS